MGMQELESDINLAIDQLRTANGNFTLGWGKYFCLALVQIAWWFVMYGRR